jgi:hypothetical protein
MIYALRRLINILVMKNKNVFFDQENQKVRWTQNTSINLPVHYNHIGSMSRVEFDLLVEVLWEVFDDSDITLQEFRKYFGEIRQFCDHIKKLIG